MSGLPYFPFYGEDWLGSSRTKLMSFEERGMYIDCLCHAWALGAIPADEKRRAHLLGTSPATLRRLWPAIAPLWESDGNGGLVNPKLEKVRAKQKTKQKAGSAGGKAGANG